MVDVVATDEFRDWYEAPSDEDEDAVYRAVDILADQGVRLGFPQTSEIKGATFALRELRVQSHGRPLRVF